MTPDKQPLQALDDCLRIKSEMHLAIGLDMQGTEPIFQVRQHIGLSVATQLCRTALFGALRSPEDVSHEEAFDRASAALASEDAPVFASAMVKQRAEQGAHATLPIFRIVPLARRLLGEVIPIVDVEMNDGTIEREGRVIVPWRFVNGLVRVSRAAVDATLPPCASIEEYASRVQADMEAFGPGRAARWISMTYKSGSFPIHPVALVSAAILSNERSLFGESRSQLNVTAEPNRAS